MNHIKRNSSQIPGGNKLDLKNESGKRFKDTQDEQEALVKEFFQDNKERYTKKPEETFLIVPVLPIKVPESLKPLLNKEQLGIKRTHEKDIEEHHKKIRLYRKRYLESKAPPIKLESNQEAIAYDKQQELRAQNLRLQSKTLLQEVQGNDPMMVAEYADEIFEKLRIAEREKKPDPHYVENVQHEITWSTRGVLIDWVIEIHYLFSLLPETLFLTVNIIDRFLSKRKVAMGKVQLVGAAALFVATKFEEMYCPALEDFLSTTNGQIEEDEFVRAECLVLQVLDFRICYANPLNFLRRLLAEDPYDDLNTRVLSKYLMEVCFIDHRTMIVNPSMTAAASLCLARTMLGRAKWPPELESLSGYILRDLKPVIEDILDYLSQPVVHDAFFKKWTSNRLLRVSIFARDWINSYYVAE